MLQSTELKAVNLAWMICLYIMVEDGHRRTAIGGNCPVLVKRAAPYGKVQYLRDRLSTIEFISRVVEVKKPETLEAFSVEDMKREV